MGQAKYEDACAYIFCFFAVFNLKVRLMYREEREEADFGARGGIIKKDDLRIETVTICGHYCCIVAFLCAIYAGYLSCTCHYRPRLQDHSPQ